ncbi:MAG: OmpH family outer membrane protein, partial [Acidobacteriota bacterium]|nr:OmpH family outer membrane protein [Acidobacteriota bacterium]
LLAAQTAPVAGAPAVASVPQANPTKVAIIVFEQAVLATNEGQRATLDVQKKYEPKKTQIDAAGAEIEQLKKQASALPANAPDEQRANLIKSIDLKEKHFNSDAEEASNSYQEDLQRALSVVAQKVGQTAAKYAQDNGFTLLMNVGGSQNAPNPVLWFDVPKMDVTQAVINAYNASSGIAAPKPSAPSAAARPRPAAPRPAAPAATTPKK